MAKALMAPKDWWFVAKLGIGLVVIILWRIAWVQDQAKKTNGNELEESLGLWGSPGCKMVVSWNDWLIWSKEPHSTKIVDMKCEAASSPGGGAVQIKQALYELHFHHSGRWLETASQVNLTLWEDSPPDKYGNETHNHVDICVLGWSGDDLRQVNWEKIDMFALVRLSNASMDFNNVGKEYIAALKKKAAE
jgi:hypothetical protein